MKIQKNAKMLNKSSSFNEYGIVVEKKNYGRMLWPLHWHNCWEIEIVASGKGSQILNGTTYQLGRGAVYILNPTDFHEVSCDTLDIYTISFTDERLSSEFINAFSGPGGGRMKTVDGPEFEQLLNIFDMLYYEQNQSLKYGDKCSEHLLSLLLSRILRVFDVPKIKKNDSRYTLAGRAISYINTHFRDNPTLSDTAEWLGITPNYLSEEFHAVTGKRYKEYLNEIRLSYAKKLLISSNLSITEICFASGYSSLSNFLRVFKEYYGISPHTMQKNM